ncbi:hypothetical protein [Actinopolymorpha pittospori]|uniref:Uncharacterized protein n=1 Tax=Actinopolymorpha pittospori TaxID=648752 RepID=A0A927RHV3_9ACTN|nr:hypothetical protein [Actinopolymorpha pittospori]MBE1605551.1 hypothetical protein [Actinopolymorpha pittospori]
MNDITHARGGQTVDCHRCQDSGWVRIGANDPDGVTRIVEASCPDCCGTPGRLQDWRDSHRWSSRQMPCRFCAAPTNLRDLDGRPAHKVCAEAAQPGDAAPANHSAEAAPELRVADPEGRGR